MKNVLNKLIFYSFLIFYTQLFAFALSGTENSAGVVFSIFRPNYGKFGTIATTAGQPVFPTQALLVGGDATFMKQGSFTGGRVLYGNTTTSTISTSASTYEIANVGLKAGHALSLGFMDMRIGTFVGMGHLNFSSVSATANGSVMVQYMFLEPFLTFSIGGGKTFLPSIGAGYHYAIPYNVTTYGDALLTKPTDATVGGINILLQLSFGDFGSSSK